MLYIILFNGYLYFSINKKEIIRENLEEKINQFGPLIDDIQYNKHFQDNDKNIYYEDYLLNLEEKLRANFHLIGSLKKIILTIVLMCFR
jgi:hypothetical protein